MTETAMMERINEQQKKLIQFGELARDIASRLQKTYQELEKDKNFDLYMNDRFWLLYIHREALIKIANIIERDLRLVATFSALTSARYVLEMLIWLRLIRANRDKFITFFIALQIAEQIQHLKSMMEHTNMEIAIYEKIGKRQDAEIFKLRDRSPKNIRRILQKYDMKLSEFFLEYEGQARKAGFSSAAKQLKNNLLPKCASDLAVLEKERLSAMEKRKDWPKKQWNWKEHAESANLKSEYEYIYGYTSRLLHCKPGSFATNQKNLEYGEMAMFHSFIVFAVDEIVRLCSAIA